MICALVGMVTGSSWTTAGTLGVAFVAMAGVSACPHAIAAGAVISGAYFGDKMTPLSETTILVPKLVGGGLTVGEHVRNMFWTAGPAIGISLVIFLVLGLTAVPQGEASPQVAVDALEASFNISVVALLPLAPPCPLLGQEGPAVSSHRGVGSLRRHSRRLHAMGIGRGLRGRSELWDRSQQASRRSTPRWPPAT